MGHSVTASLLLLAFGASAHLTLPDYVRPCSIKQSDRKLSQCAVERAREIIPKVLKGDPKYNVPVLDPLHFDRIDVIQGNGPLGLQLFATDVNMSGLPNMVIDTITHESNPLRDTFVLSIPELVINAKYNISGRILLLPIVGVGNLVMNLKNTKLTYQYNVSLEKLEDGEIYYFPQPGQLEITTEGMKLHLDNLFNGDKTLLETTNNFLNQEWKDVFESLKPSFSDTISKLLSDMLNGIFRSVPYKEAFLDVE